MNENTPTRRVRDVTQLPDEALQCAVAGRHVGFVRNDPVIIEAVPWWTNVTADEVHYRCDCGRWKQEAVDHDTAERVSRSVNYGGGVLLVTGGQVSQTEAKAEWLRRVRARREAAEHGQADGTVRPLFRDGRPG